MGNFGETFPSCILLVSIFTASVRNETNFLISVVPIIVLLLQILFINVFDDVEAMIISIIDL